MNYLHTIAKQLDIHEIHESADLVVVANEGQPALVYVSYGDNVLVYKQDKRCKRLVLMRTV